MKASRILETAIYAGDLDAAEAFYRDVLGLERIARGGNRHIFFRVGDGVLLIFNPAETIVPSVQDQLPVPPHGCEGVGHLCFSATADELADWEKTLTDAGVAIESRVHWPNGSHSIYFRDPAGNSLEFAEPRIWGLS